MKRSNAKYTVRERGNQGMIHNPDNDRIWSYHRTLSAAERVVEKGQRRAKQLLGPTAYTTLYVYDETSNK